MEQNIRIVDRIQLFCIIAIIFNCILFVAFIFLSEGNWLVLVTEFQILVMFYILHQIKNACFMLKTLPIFSKKLSIYFRKVAYACFVSGIGSTIIGSIVLSIMKNKVWIQLNLTTVGIGLLVFAGSYIYEKGCDQKSHIDVTI